MSLNKYSSGSNILKFKLSREKTKIVFVPKHWLWIDIVAAMKYSIERDELEALQENSVSTNSEKVLSVKMLKISSTP